eukprot:Nitzschia sp. Nitz4//scaffold107_size73032//12908//14512//NITZ4_005756-RA/size73032-processed-gene-0.69-mRNA-1//-1//CDS//3329532581//1120//frame0
MLLLFLFLLCTYFQYTSSTSQVIWASLPVGIRSLYERAPSDIDTASTESSAARKYAASSSFRTSFLDDFAPRFCAEDEDEDLTKFIQAPDVTHFCFLLHGHRGLSNDLAYMQHVMRRCAVEEKEKRNGTDVSKEQESNASTSDAAQKSNLIQDMVVYTSTCNEHKTQDGVRKGGDRLVEEMKLVIDGEMSKRFPDLFTTDKRYNVTISILGNSLGGLFGRYAIAKFIERYCVKDTSSDSFILDGRYNLSLNIFCTTATPHLGVSRHTYVKIPRTAEIGVAHALGDTGKDIFRLNDLLHQMATSPTFLDPLANFRKRIAYANAYGTDFPVPASTAAFLSDTSDYPHHFVALDSKTEMDAEHNDAAGFIIATLQTKSGASSSSDSSSNEELENLSEDQRELDIMSRNLDALGWKKVFLDIRPVLPTAEVPQGMWTRRQNSDVSDSECLLDETTVSCLQSLKSQGSMVESKEIANAVAMPADNRLAIPLAHNMMVAFSRSRMSAHMHKGGRPIVDALAKELVHGMFSWDAGVSTQTS